jgi:enamine deaminase RidA (YjgF/YER057c/UK114 family)
VTSPSTVAERLAARGITLPNPAALALYRPAVRAGDLVYVSGQVAMRDGAVVHPGRVGDGVSVDQAREAASVCTVNALGAAHALLGSLEHVRVVRAVGYVASAPDFIEQPAVVNAASELLRDLLGEDRGVGARLALGVASLPVNSPVELELILEID